ncbi:MAG: 50S ribosomal protein L3 [Nanoarchaeota archaeon]|nr:50S ribosomal protein L3 [Nanoarchaeota archaeon]
MGKAHKPRCGSLMVWPRKRARRSYARLRHQSIKALHHKDAKPIGFGGYKAGMTHVMLVENRAKSPSKGQVVSYPVTVIECPPLKVMSIRAYKRDNCGMRVSTEILSDKIGKDAARKIDIPKKVDTAKKVQEIEAKLGEYGDIKVIVHTQPRLIGFKKKPDVFELALGGNIKDKFAWAKEHLGKEITVEQILSAGQQVDAHGITKGKGFQGPVARFGVALRHHKSEKARRNPGNLGAWTPKHVGYEVAHAGQMGYHQRTDYNKQLLKISSKPEEINPQGGFLRYGMVKNSCLLVKGSVPGPLKRMIILTVSIRPDKLMPKDAPTVEHINTDSKQGN